MKGTLGSIGFALLLHGAVAAAQTKQDEEAVRAVPHAYADAWAKHDGHALAQVMAEHVDFVTVGAFWLQGRTDFEKYHTRLLTGRFKGSILTPLEIVVRFIRPDLAVLHWSWRIEGDKNVDGSARPPRFGLVTMLVENHNGGWLVAVSQNSNAGSGTTEPQDVKPPIVVPPNSTP